jgi:carotenoid cleavage dioxygenase-like enzyme
MIHAMRIKDGTLQYSNKYTMTDKLREELKHGKPLALRVGEFSQGFFSLWKMMIYQFYKVIGYHPDFEKFKDGPANTAFVTHANKTYALAEQCYPFEINIPKESNEFDIESKGY